MRIARIFILATPNQNKTRKHLAFAIILMGGCIFQENYKKEFKHRLKWTSVKKLFVGEHTSSIEGEIEDIEMNNINGRILSNGLRAHKVGPQDSITIIDQTLNTSLGRLETAL